MKKTTFYSIWAGLYVLCGGLSLIPAPAGALRVVMTLLSLLFFLPPLFLLLDARRSGDAKTMKLLRLLSILSLSLTFLLLIANIAAVLAPQVLGNILYSILIFVSVPMVCSGHYVLSLFLWACLLLCTLLKKTTNHNPQDQT